MMFNTLAREQYVKERDPSMPVQAVSRYFVTFYDDVFLSQGSYWPYYKWITRKHIMCFSNSATYKDSVTFVKNISLVRLDKAIKKMRKWENILYKDFEYLFYKK